ncbi:MAG: NifB/NifX family molybdenum-iron cluster-binding protein [Veillonellales bacterium]
MKIAITAHGKNRLAKVDSRFSQAGYFVIYDQKKAVWSSLANTQTAESVYGTKALAEKDIKILITGYIGAKSFKLLQANQIAIYSSGETTSTAEEILSTFLSGKLALLYAPNALDMQNRKQK